jgi:EamA domain-containing membrane protein RarD
MNLVAISFAVIGLLVGLLVWSHMVRISYAVYGAVRKIDFRAHLKDPSDRQVKKMLLVLVATSCIWALAFGTVAFLLRSAPEWGWAWFFGGVAATPALVARTTSVALRRLKKHGAQGAQL